MALALRHCLVHVVQVGLNESDRMLRLNTRTHIVLTNPVIFSRKILKVPLVFPTMLHVLRRNSNTIMAVIFLLFQVH